MTRATLLLVLCTILTLASGCYSPKAIDSAYFASKPSMTVTIGKCPEKAQMQDSGQGGLIGVAVNAGRAATMREAMSGIAGDTVKELVRQRFSEKMEEYFDVADNGQLKTVIDIYQWGWFTPSTVVGLRTGSFQFLLSGAITITDNQQGNKKIAFLQQRTTEAIGDKPTAELSQQALLKCADKFAADTVAFLTKAKAGKSR
jgi:hypothetical protein